MNLTDTLEAVGKGAVYLGAAGVLGYCMNELAKKFYAKKNEKYFVDEEILKNKFDE